MDYIDSINTTNYFNEIDWPEIKTPQYWYKNEPVITIMINAISLAITEGERFIVKAVKSYEDSILDNRLSQETKAFLAEEYTHILHHTRFNKDLIRHGYPIDFVMKFLRIGYTLMQKFTSQEMKLAQAVCFENMACSMAKIALEKKIFTGNTSTIFDLFTWHSFEETSHRNFLIDFYYSMGGGYFRRIVAFIFSTICIQWMTGIIIFLFLSADAINGKRAKCKHYIAAIKLAWYLKKGYKYYFSCCKVQCRT